MIKNKLRKVVFSILNRQSIDNFYKIYYRARYPSSMQKKCSFGELNPDKYFYVIRPRTDGTEGLMSLFMNVIKNIYYAIDNNYIPIIDFKNYSTQYSDKINGETNSWNFYFCQPSTYTLEEVYSSKNVILSGLDIQWYHNQLFERNFSNNQLLKLSNFIYEYIDFNDEVKKNVNSQKEILKIKDETTLGLYLRGTDYTYLKPAGHPIQPTVNQATEIVDEYLKKYNIDKIFLVTEDGKIYDEIKKKYGKKCVIVTYDTFIRDYSGKNFLSHDKSINNLSDSPYERGLNYLIKIIILSECRYFIGGNTMGSWGACALSKESFFDKFIFDLGTYGK